MSNEQQSELPGKDLKPGLTAEERRGQFANWPNTFATIKLVIGEDGDIGAVYQFEGDKLKAQGVSPAKAALAYTVTQMAATKIEQALVMANIARDVLHTLAGGDDDDSKDDKGSDGGGESGVEQQ